MGVGVAVGMIWRLCGFGVGMGMAGFVQVLGFGVGVVLGGGLVGEEGAGFGEVVAFEDMDFGAGDAAAVYGLDAEGGVKVEGCGGLVEDARGDAGFEEGSEEHVAGDAGEAVEIGEALGHLVFDACGLWGV